MADSTDFIPTEAEIDVEAAYFNEDIKNLAEDEEISTKVVDAVDDFDGRYTAQRQDWIEENGIWNQCDWAFHACLNDTITQSEKAHGANEPSTWERAKTGTTQFYRQVTQKAANQYAVQTSKDVPFKYTPLLSDDLDEPEIAEERAQKMNLLAKWSMKKDKFNRKSLDFATQINKYGNIPVGVEWMQKRKRITQEVPVYDENNPGEILEYKQVVSEKVHENRPVITIFPVESVKADINIGCLQDQDCVEVVTLVGMSDIIAGIESGEYRKDLLKDIEKSHQWDGYSGFENNREKTDNYAGDSTQTMGTGRYLKREVFINLPIDDETWDEKENIPMRYRVTMFGNQPTDSVVARINRNQEPDDAIPLEMMHCNPDDSDLLYHISSYEVIRSNIATETTLIRQVIDNNTLINKPPMWEVTGGVLRGKDGVNDRKFGPDQRFVVNGPDSLGFVQVPSTGQITLGVLDYLKEDSNTANSIDKNMMGESFGARTSATEAGTISGNSRRPNLVNIEYILDQFLGFIAWRYKVLWEAYGRHDQVVQITDENDNVTPIKPQEAVGEYDIVIDIVNDIRDDEVKAQRILNYATTVAQTPMVNTVDWVELNKELAEYMLGTKKFVVDGGLDGDAEALAMNNVKMMLEYGEFPLMNPAMNLKKHLEVYKEARTQWAGREDDNPNVKGVLDAVIAQIEQRMQAEQSGGAVAPTPATNQALLSGAMGGIQ